jgi:hypothetical protein
MSKESITVGNVTFGVPTLIINEAPQKTEDQPTTEKVADDHDEQNNHDKD